MFDSDNPKSPYSPNDPRNPRNPTDQKHPSDPNDPKNPKSPFGPGGPSNPEGLSPPLTPQDMEQEKGRHLGAVSEGASTLQPVRADKMSIQASDIKALLQNTGKVTLNGRTLTLKDPAVTDERLLSMMEDPTLLIMPMGDSKKSGPLEYKLTSAGRTLTVKIDRQVSKEK